MPKRHSREEFIKLAKEKHGLSYDYSMVKYVNNKIPVIIICPKHGVFSQRPDSHLSGKGCYYCGLDEQKCAVYGFGYNDLYETQGSPLYSTWQDMIERCYGNRDRNKSYEKCWVSDKWRFLSEYKKWFDENYVPGFVLDKDILVSGNKMYGPTTCLFVPREINELFISSGEKEGNLPRGVYYLKRLNKYCAQINNKDSTTKHIGLYGTPEEARNAYIEEKLKIVKSVADRYYSQGIITDKIYQAIINHKF